MKSWFMAGSDPQDYELGIDANAARNGKHSGFPKANVAEPRGFGTMMQKFQANAYLNKRMRFSAFVKSECIEAWAGLWMRIDGPQQQRPRGFDNMQDRPIKGTTGWHKYDVVLNVPQESVAIALGILLVGKGQIWISEVQFEEVGQTCRQLPMRRMKTCQRNRATWILPVTEREAGSRHSHKTCWSKGGHDDCLFS